MLKLPGVWASWGHSQTPHTQWSVSSHHCRHGNCCRSWKYNLCLPAVPSMLRRIRRREWKVQIRHREPCDETKNPSCDLEEHENVMRCHPPRCSVLPSLGAKSLPFGTQWALARHTLSVLWPRGGFEPSWLGTLRLTFLWWYEHLTRCFRPSSSFLLIKVWRF